MEAMQQRRRGSNADAIGPSQGRLPCVVACPRAAPGVEEEDGGVGGRRSELKKKMEVGFLGGRQPELNKKKTEVGFLRSRRLELKKMEVGLLTGLVPTSLLNLGKLNKVTLLENLLQGLVSSFLS
uniref:Uncharacterized protein n=1 Tax=Oryza meridionalis TaxID=40149 RepID=A0A0E0DLA2_9ORYZ